MKGFKNILCLVVIAAVFSVRGEEGGEQATGEATEEAGQEMDWGQMLEMGMEFGKQILGEEVVEKLKQGDMSTLMDLGQKVMKEDMVKNFLKTATDAMNTKEKDENLSERPSNDSVSEGEDKLEGEEDESKDEKEGTKCYDTDGDEIECEAGEESQDALSSSDIKPSSEKLEDEL